MIVPSWQSISIQSTKSVSSCWLVLYKWSTLILRPLWWNCLTMRCRFRWICVCWRIFRCRLLWRLLGCFGLLGCILAGSLFLVILATSCLLVIGNSSLFCYCGQCISPNHKSIGCFLTWPSGITTACFC